jgi:CO dehydrogenase/acetyl-CoA synthase epsilon subunit
MTFRKRDREQGFDKSRTAKSQNGLTLSPHHLRVMLKKAKRPTLSLSPAAHFFDLPRASGHRLTQRPTFRPTAQSA